MKHLLLVCVQLLMSTIWIVVEADVIESPTSEQLTTVPFILMLTESMDSVEVRGDMPWTEVLRKMNVAEFTTLCDTWLASLELICTGLATSTNIPCSLVCEILHLMNCTDAVHVIWSGAPTRHTGATIIGDNVSTPTNYIIIWCILGASSLAFSLANAPAISYC